MPGVLDLVNYVQQQGDIGRQRGEQNRLGQLYQQGLSAPTSDRRGIVGQMAAVNPQAAMQAQKSFADLDESDMKEVGRMAYLLEAAPDEQKAAIYESQIVPRMRQSGLMDVPPTYDPKFAPMLQRIASVYGGAGQSGRVQSTYVDAMGNRIAIMADGSTQALGQNAPNNQIIDTGNGFYGVNKGNLNAAPVMVGGQQQLAMPPGSRQISNFQATSHNDATGESIPLDQLPQDEQQAAMQAILTGQTVTLPPSGQQLRSTPKPADPGRMARTLTPEEIAQRGYRPGSIVQVDGLGNERVVQQPTQAAQSMSAAERKNILAAKAKVPQLQNAIRGLDRIDAALKQLEGGLVNTGPVDQFAMRFTEAGQELEAAVGGIQNSFLALTRVPGIGSQSDLEARIASLQYPSLDKSPEVNRRTMENLKFFARDLANAYKEAVGNAADSAVDSADQQPGSVSIESLLEKYR